MTTTCSCLLCGASAELAFQKHWGFQAPDCYDLYECPECETSFAQPMSVNPAIYDLIYRNAEKVSGYDRYGRYRDLLKLSADPLRDMCEQEDVYWAIRESIRGIAVGRDKPLRILEVGSGFGYLTYALRRAGYDCTGIDISQEAVSMAVRDFGDFYRVADLMALTVAPGEAFDIVVATELIEHIPNPTAILEKAASLLNEGGALLVTTPNRDLYPRKLVWHTDPPPVHLWWFSKTSFRFLAWKLGMSVKFVDFASFYGRNGNSVRGPSKPQTFDAKGDICFKDSPLRTLARNAVAKVPALFRPLAKVLLTSLAVGKIRDRLFRDSLSLCVILERRKVTH
jgi:2-polyprenyl-3-methyl-5-hydroxy-6-metoxy-1,4-benzoquinol methylase